MSSRAHDGPSHVAPPIADPLDRSRFPTDEWRLVETRFDADDVGTTESLFAVGNGYLGMRGNYSESRDAHVDGTYINGFHETWPILHAEEAYGFARIGQTIVNAPDAKVIRLYVDDEPLHMSMADLLGYERALDFRSGQLTRELVWRTPGGKEVRLRSTRMVPLAQRHLAVLTFEVTLLDQKALGRDLVAAAQPAGRDRRDDRRHGHRRTRPAKGRPLRAARARTGPARRRPRDRPAVPRLPRGAERDDDRCGRRPRSRDRRRRTPCGCRPRTTWRRWSTRSRPSPASRSASPSWSATTPLPRSPRASYRPLRAHPLPHPRAGCRAPASPSSASGSTTSGPAATSRSPATRSCSRRCAGTCSRSARRPRAPRARASRRRGSPARVTAATTSGTPRST